MGQGAEERIGDSHIMSASRQFKIKMDLPVLKAFRQTGRRFFTAQAVSQQRQFLRKGRNIKDIQIAGNTGAYNTVIDRFPVAFRKTFKAAGHAENRSHIAGIAVRVPARHSRYLNRPVEPAFSVCHSHEADACIRDNMAYTLIFIIAPVTHQHLIAAPP